MFAPPTRIEVISLSGSPDKDLLAEAEARLRSEPGLGAVVISGLAVVVHKHLLSFVPAPTGDPDAAWIDGLCGVLIRRGYLIERTGTAPAATGGGSKPGGKLRQLVRRKPRSLVLQARQRWRRSRFLRRLRWEAWLIGAPLKLDVAKDLVVEPGVRIEVYAVGGSLLIGPRCVLASGVILRLGGELQMLRNVAIRHDVALNVKGRLVLEGRNVLSRGTMVHADGDMLFEWGASTAEYVSILDSHHEHDGSLVHVHDQAVEIQDTTIGAATLLGAGVLIMPGVHVGRSCLVGSHSVVTKDIPDGWIAVGAPARHLRPVVPEDVPAPQEKAPKGRARTAK